MPIVPAPIQQAQIVTPANPPSGSLRLYPKADGNFYKLDSAGVESALVSAGTQAADTEEFLPAAAATTVTLGRTPSKILLVTRDGLAQSYVDGHYTLAGSTLTFTDAFTGAERVAVTYAFGTIYAAGPMGPSASVHEEFLPTNGATTVTLAQAVQAVLLVARNGVVQSETDSNYSRAGNILTFTDAFDGTERVVVEYAQSTVTATPPFDGSGLVNGSVTNAKLAVDVARENHLTNPGFEVWQRGTGPFTGSGVYNADRWLSYLQGTDALSITRIAATLPDSQYALQAVFTLGTGVTPANSSAVYQQLKKADGLALNGKVITLAINVNSATVGAAVAYLSTDGTGGGFSSSSASVAGQQRLTVTATVPNDATVVNLGVRLLASATVVLDDAVLAVGSVATNYTPLHPVDDLIRCQRYYEKIGGDGRNDLIFSGYLAAAGTLYFLIPWRVVKAVYPTVTVVEPTSWHGNSFQAGGIAVNTFSEFAVRISVTSNAAGMFYTTNDTGKANIVAEANP